MAGPDPAIHAFLAATLKAWMPGSSPGMTSVVPYADFSNSSRPISMRRISLVPAPIS